MGTLIGRQEEYKIRKKLVLENVRRVFFTSLVCVVLLPIMMLINKRSASEFAPIAGGMMTVAEIFSVLTVGISFFAMKNRDLKLATLIYRSFWLIFEAMCFVLTYSDKVSGRGMTFYSILAVALFLIPIMHFSEQMYYIVLLAVYSVFLSLKFQTGLAEIFNMLVLAGMVIAMSRILYARFIESMSMKERERELKDNEAIDPMTGLLNRKGLEKHIDEEMRDCIKGRRRASILMIDIDEMSKYNDSYGIERGDECIRTVAEYICQIILRNTDTICRLNGGRFIVFMEGGSDMEPVALAEKIRSNIERRRIPHGRRASNPFLTVSIGVASCIPRYENSFTEMYDEAEDALFEAKERGRNVTVYDEQVYGNYSGRAAN